jgi:CMP-2-keto-3-deoxyoctulosonic acid synthetase
MASSDDTTVMSTAVTPFRAPPGFVNNPHRVKCVVDFADRALYFSRSAIPHGAGACAGASAMPHGAGACAL